MQYEKEAIFFLTWNHKNACLDKHITQHDSEKFHTAGVQII